jgi:predicted RNase H-like nuclease (RuvC/YqgF family)
VALAAKSPAERLKLILELRRRILEKAGELEEALPHVAGVVSLSKEKRKMEEEARRLLEEARALARRAEEAKRRAEELARRQEELARQILETEGGTGAPPSAEGGGGGEGEGDGSQTLGSLAAGRKAPREPV